MKNLLKKLLRLLLIPLLLFAASCEGPEGPAGEDGVDGTNGIDGVDGENGVNGLNDQDGNANVSTYTFDTSALDSFVITIPELTEDVLANDVILTYVKRSDVFPFIGKYYQIPGISFEEIIEVEMYVGNIDLYFYDQSTGNAVSPTVGSYEALKVIIIKSTENISSTAAKNLSSEAILGNIDTSDYAAVCDHLGIDY